MNGTGREGIPKTSHCMTKQIHGCHSTVHWTDMRAAALPQARASQKA
jgi:hypothetical protein